MEDLEKIKYIFKTQKLNLKVLYNLKKTELINEHFKTPIKKDSLIKIMKKLNVMDKEIICEMIINMKKKEEKKQNALNDENTLKYWSKEEIKKDYEKNQEKYISIIKDFLEYIKTFDNEIKLKKIVKKKRPKTPKMKELASCPSSYVNSELIKSRKTELVDKTNNMVKTNLSQTKAGMIAFSEKFDETYSPFTKDLDILNNHLLIEFTREELQVYYGLFSLYCQNIPDSKYRKRPPFQIETKEFHNNVLKRYGHLQKRDLERYKRIINKLRNKNIIFNTNGAIIPPFKFKNMRDIEIDCNLINIDIETVYEYKYQLITITPTKFTLMELTQARQYQNSFPHEFIQLGFDKSDNIFYFGLYLMRIHRTNKKNNRKPWEVRFKRIIEEALPNGGKSINEIINKKRDKKKFFMDNIENPLIEAIEIFEKYKIIERKNKIKSYYEKNIEKLLSEDSETKLELIFNYYKNEKNNN
jgi:hypothetical protein